MQIRTLPHSVSLAAPRRRALVICAHLRPGRTARRSRHFMQTMAGVHIGSLIDPTQFDVTLHHEDWHGPYDTQRTAGYDLVFLSGLQADFDRTRQLAYHFRRSGATVVAGGSIPTLYPEFCTQFFDAVCAGGVECVPDVVADFLAGALRPIYRSPIREIGRYALDHGLLTRNNIRTQAHLIETSRGCSFRCSFCVMPSEVGGHAAYRIEAVRQMVDDAIATSPRFSFRRNWPMFLLQDNNFSDDRAHMLAVADLMRDHPRVRGWGALVTQNVLRDTALIERLAASKCRALFVGLESLDTEFLRRFNKKQNLGRDSVIEMVAAAEASGLTIGYGYLFDPRHQTVPQMEAQLRLIAQTDALSMPVYLSLVAPLLGTQAFWEDADAGQLAPNLRLRDLDGETIAYQGLADTHKNLSAFVDRMFRRPYEVVGRRAIRRKVVRRLLRPGARNPLDLYIRTAASMHCFAWARAYPSNRRTYLAGENVLDPQYADHPADLSDADRARYFEPVAITDGAGALMPWLRAIRRRPIAASSEPAEAAPGVLLSVV